MFLLFHRHYLSKVRVVIPDRAGITHKTARIFLFFGKMY